jgi:GTP-binding protein
MFIDEVEITVIAGKGGDGCVSFRREKYVPFGGPDGGDGGDGGNIVFLAKENTSTLYHLKGRKIYKAKNGEKGKGKQMTGAKGEDTIIVVPVGTIVTDIDTGIILADMDEKDKSVIIANGGKGGKGNIHFTSSVNQVPRKATPGTEGEQYNLRLELKSIADVGLVGFPNAGKSTLISMLSNARPKIAPYPFTTLIPNLGVVSYSYYETYVIADIPGLIEGASEGVGLGIKFLKHIERTNLLLFIIDISEDDYIKKYGKLRKELKKYSKKLLKKERCVAFNKIDLLEEEEVNKRIDEFKKLILTKEKKEIEVFAISALSNIGLDNLRKSLYYKVVTEKNKKDEVLDEGADL